MTFRHVSSSTYKKLITVFAIPLAVFTTSYAIESQPEVLTESPVLPALTVSVISQRAEQHQSYLDLNGEVRAHYQLDLKAKVAAEVSSFYGDLDPGVRIKAGQPLIKLDDTNYQQILQQARYNLAQAELNLLTEQRQARQARDEWQLSQQGTKPSSALVLREPQLKVAELALQQSKAAVLQAKRDLARCQVKAPFDSILVQRHVSPGQLVSAADPVLTLYSTDRADIELNLSQQQWRILFTQQQIANGYRVEVFDSEGHSWQGEVRSAALHVEKTNRLRPVLITVTEPLTSGKPLLAGSFVAIRIPLSLPKATLDLPATAISGDGQLWYVDEGQTLLSVPARIVYQQGGRVWVTPPDNGQQPQRTWKLLKQPLPGYRVGQKVAVQEVTA